MGKYMKCYNHPEKEATLKCVSCDLLLCRDCVKAFQAGGFFTYFCPGCNSQCEEIQNEVKTCNYSLLSRKNSHPPVILRSERPKDLIF